jgi:hypothetical protein
MKRKDLIDISKKTYDEYKNDIIFRIAKINNIYHGQVINKESNETSNLCVTFSSKKRENDVLINYRRTTSIDFSKDSYSYGQLSDNNIVFLPYDKIINSEIKLFLNMYGYIDFIKLNYFVYNGFIKNVFYNTHINQEKIYINDTIINNTKSFLYKYDYNNIKNVIDFDIEYTKLTTNCYSLINNYKNADIFNKKQFINKKIKLEEEINLLMDKNLFHDKQLELLCIINKFNSLF